ncbi:hypothetical protein GCM10028817_19590 [Spirosoma pomorum]
MEGKRKGLSGFGNVTGKSLPRQLIDGIVGHFKPGVLEINLVGNDPVSMVEKDRAVCGHS